MSIQNVNELERLKVECPGNFITLRYRTLYGLYFIKSYLHLRKGGVTR